MASKFRNGQFNVEPLSSARLTLPGLLTLVKTTVPTTSKRDKETKKDDKIFQEQIFFFSKIYAPADFLLELVSLRSRTNR